MLFETIALLKVKYVLGVPQAMTCDATRLVATYLNTRCPQALQVFQGILYVA